MKLSRISTIIISTALVASCGTTSDVVPQLATKQTASQPRKIDQDEAFSFIRAQANQNSTPHQEREPLYTQAINKSEPCKIQTSQDQLDRNNFRAYWDGQCKNGFAYGLGRDISISDSHHLEEITIYGIDGKIINSPSVNYDFVHNKVAYSFEKDQESEYSSVFLESIENELGNFSIEYTLILKNSSDDQIVKWSPLSPQTTLLNIKNNVVYKYTANELAGTVNPNSPVQVGETLNAESGEAGGFALVKYSNGQVMHFKVGGSQPEPVTLPQEYISEIIVRYDEIQNSRAKASSDIEKAKAMEKEYLYFACTGKHKISGLDNSISNKICTWRDQFQEPLRIAQKQYNDNVERIKSEARSKDEQRKIQGQLDQNQMNMMMLQNQNERNMMMQQRQADDAAFQRTLQNIQINKPVNCITNFGITTCY